MKKTVKIIVSVVLVLGFAVSMFYCLVAGAPEPGEGLAVYTAAAAGFSLLSSIFVCAGIHYISYLQKELKKARGEDSESGFPLDKTSILTYYKKQR